MSLKLYQFFGTITEYVKKTYPVIVVATNEEEAKETASSILRDEDALVFQAGTEKIVDSKSNTIEFKVQSGFKLPFNSKTANLQRRGHSTVAQKLREMEREERNREIAEKAQIEKAQKAKSK